MIYGQQPEGMSPEEWTVECQCRHVAREMKAGRTRQARAAIFEEWKKRLPGITKERVGAIWKEGVPMPGRNDREKEA